MKATLAIVVVALAVVVSAALYSRSIDPRPAGTAMGEQLRLAVAHLGPNDAAEGFASLADRYTGVARSVAEVELRYGSDADLLAYAQRVLDRPALAGTLLPQVQDMAPVQAELLDALQQGLSHVGAPDDRFVQVMIPIDTAIAELGRLADAAQPATAFRATDPATLMSASAAAALASWTGLSTHTH